MGIIYPHAQIKAFEPCLTALEKPTLCLEASFPGPSSFHELKVLVEAKMRLPSPWRLLPSLCVIVPQSEGQQSSKRCKRLHRDVPLSTTLTVP